MVPLDKGICSVCGKRPDGGIRHLQQAYIESVKRLQQGEASFEQGKHDRARDIFETLLADFGEELYRSHVVIYSSLHHLTQLCATLGDLAAAAAYCRRAIRCLQEVFPPYHTETAMMHRELGHIEWRRLFAEGGAAPSPAVAAFDAALAIVGVCLGEGRDAYAELRGARARCGAGKAPPAARCRPRVDVIERHF